MKFSIYIYIIIISSADFVEIHYSRLLNKIHSITLFSKLSLINPKERLGSFVNHMTEFIHPNLVI
jgi:hypothetical protein